jgi:PiT family inorganic phosphate transporter
VISTFGASQISGVAKTITSGLVQHQAASQWMVLCAVSGAIIWNLLTWYFGIPSSSSYALVGGLLGAAFLHKGPDVIIWQGVIYKVILPMIISPMLGFSLGLLFMKILYRYVSNKENWIFRHLQIGSASIVAFSHGLNDAQKSMGMITLGLLASGFLTSPQIPLWVILSCALMMGLGTASGGWRIIRTMGFRITKLEPIQGFAAELGASCVILGASLWGMPVSSTYMIVGSITGVGAAKGMKAVKWDVAKTMALTWIITLPGSAFFAAMAYKAVLFFGFN